MVWVNLKSWIKINSAASVNILLFANVSLIWHWTTKLHFIMKISIQNTAGHTPITLQYDMVPTHKWCFNNCIIAHRFFSRFFYISTSQEMTPESSTRFFRTYSCHEIFITASLIAITFNYSSIKLSNRIYFLILLDALRTWKARKTLYSKKREFDSGFYLFLKSLPVFCIQIFGFIHEEKFGSEICFLTYLFQVKIKTK